jgi:serine/threonine protein kinase
MAIAVYPGKKSPEIRAVGRYELREKLGEGGMGVVWRALDSRIGGDVALKIMKDCSDPAALELFSKEWRALADLSHPNIVDVRDVDVLVEEGKQKPFFVMPLLRGATLSDLIAGSSERLTVARVVEIISQVCRGLQAAHQRGLVHRDLKPSNIFVMDDDTAKVIDFGVVYLAGTHSITGRKGTYQYMSPEQMQMKEVTPASDLFAVGVILYEALTGRKPFACTTVEETSEAVLKRFPPPVSELNPAIPHAVSQVVHKCLAKQAIHRFSSAKELADTLQRAFRGEEVFDSSKLRLRVDRVKAALKTDEGFASELLSELESEGHLDSEITMLRSQIDITMKQRKIRQLMESARARIEQDEIPLALDKLREVLVLDPDNVDALALKTATESRRSEAQAAKWVELGTTHLDNCDFVAARHAAQEALACRVGDTRAVELLGKIDLVEAEAKRVREQKEELYNTAMRAYQNGEIDSALSRMVRLFSVVRSRPEGAVPERDAVYESFYQQVRSEHDSIRLLLEAVQHEFAEENFQQALALCAEHLAKYPQDGAFQALKIQIEDAERQKVSSYIAMVTKNADAEPDLDRRANILREASERYPNEAQFAQQLKVVRERRDLVNSIAAKARQFGERGQYSEELSQWDMLRSIHPRFPGLNFELEQCRKRRDQQAQDEEKARLVEEIVRLMDARDFSKALERARLALNDFPGDTELAGLEKLSADGLERSKEASKLLALGQAEAAAMNWNESTDYLRRALKLDPRNVALKEALISVLTEQARTVLDKNWAEAQRLHQEASVLDCNHRSVRTLGTEISEARRQAYVGECLTDARALVAEGNHDGAYERIRKGREEYPNDMRLEQYEAWLLKENQELRVRQERASKLAELGAARQQLERVPNSENARRVLRHVNELSAQAPDDPETMQRIADAEQTVRKVIGTDDLSSLLQMETEMPIRQGQAVSDADDAATRLYQPNEKKTKDSKVQDVVTEKGPAVNPISTRSRNMLIGGGVAGILLIVGAALLFLLPHRPPPPSPPPPPAKVHVSVTPVDSTIRVNGVAANGGEISIPAGRTVEAEVSRLGYKTASVVLDGKVTAQTIALEPLATRVSLVTAEKSGTIELDGSKVGELSDGAADGVEVPTDGQSHTLAVVVGGKRTINLKFKTDPGAQPQLDPIGDQDVLVITNLGTAATIYGSPQIKNPGMNGTPIRLSARGSDEVALVNGQNELTVEGNDTSSVALTPADWPSVTLHALGAPATMLITSNVNDATLTVNGSPMKRGRNGWQISQPGTYNFVLSADHYEPQKWTVVLKPRQSLPPDKRQLVAKVVGAAAPESSALVIAGGMPGAQVEVDGKSLGELNGSGSAQFTGKLTAGTHPVVFRKDGFCDVHSEVTAKPPAAVQLAGSKMEPCGSLTFTTVDPPGNARVRRADDPNSKWIPLPVGQRVPLPIGMYVAEADFGVKGSKKLPDLTVKQGQDGVWKPKPTEETKSTVCQLQTSSDATTVGEWLKGNKEMLLTPGCVNVSLTFAKPKGNLFGMGKKMEWIVYAGEGGRIEYELDENNKLTRKVVIGKTAGEPAEKNVDLKDGDTYVLKIQVEGQRVRILNKNGAPVDEYTATDEALKNLRGGHVGLKTNAEFKFGGSQ